MKHKNKKRGVLLKSGIQRETLIKEFISGMSLREIGKRYHRTSERIWQIIRLGCRDREFENYAEQHRQSRKAVKLAQFIAYAESLGRVPRLNELRAHTRGLQSHYLEFRKVAEARGLAYSTGEFRRGRKRKYTSDQLIAYLKEMASRLGYTPSCNDINEEGKYTHNMYVTAFGSLKKAQELAGLMPNKKFNSVENARRHAKYVTREHCLEDLKRIHRELGSPPTLAQLKEHGIYSFSKYYSRLGGIKKIRTLAELQERNLPNVPPGLRMGA